MYDSCNDDRGDMIDFGGSGSGDKWESTWQQEEEGISTNQTKPLYIDDGHKI